MPDADFNQAAEAIARRLDSLELDADEPNAEVTDRYVDNWIEDRRQEMLAKGLLAFDLMDGLRDWYAAGKPTDVADLRARSRRGDDIEEVAYRELARWTDKAERLAVDHARRERKGEKVHASDARHLAKCRRQAAAFAQLVAEEVKNRQPVYPAHPLTTLPCEWNAIT